MVDREMDSSTYQGNFKGYAHLAYLGCPVFTVNVSFFQVSLTQGQHD